MDQLFFQMGKSNSHEVIHQRYTSPLSWQTLYICIFQSVSFLFYMTLSELAVYFNDSIKITFAAKERLCVYM